MLASDSQVERICMMRQEAVPSAAMACLGVVMGGLAIQFWSRSGGAALVAGLCGVSLVAGAWHVYRLVAALRLQVLWLKGTLDAVPQPITVTDLNMKWIFVNKVTEGLLGKNSRQIQGRHCSEWGAAICGTGKCGIQSLRSGRPRTEYMQSMPDGGSRAMTVDTSYILDAGGNRMGHVEIVTDTHAKYELESIYSQIASSLEEISSTMTELDAQVKDNASHADEANRNAADARRAVGAGRETVTGLAEAMKQISLASRRILGINKTVDDIAFQTNILALNAAVEAARAGEAGAGFAVVADEVRNLARKAAEAARETSELIGTAATEIDRGAGLADQAAAALATIEDSSKSVHNLVGMMAQASGQQSSGISAISQAIHQLEQSALSHAHNSMAGDLVQIRQ